MANTLTPNIGLEIPDYSDPKWHIPLDANFYTLDTLIGQINNNGVAGTVFWQKFTIQIKTGDAQWYVNNAAVGARSSSSGTQQIPLFTAGVRQVFHAILIKHSVVFVGGTGCTVSIGTAGAPDTLMLAAGDAFDLTQSISASHFYTCGGIKSLGFATTPVIAQIVVTGANASALTAGTFEIDALLSTLP